MKRVLDLAAPVALLAILLAAWELACRALDTPSYFLPPPSAILAAMGKDADNLLMSAWNTLFMAVEALALVSVIGTAAALAVGSSPRLELAVKPLAVALQVTPIIAIAPLVVIWAGLDHPRTAILSLAAVVAFFPVFSGAVTGLKSADPDLERLFDLYGANRFQRLFRLRLPSAVPAMLEGHKVAAGQTVVGVVVAEFVAGSGATQGLAWRIMEAWRQLQTARMFAALFTLTLLGFLLFAAAQAVEKAALKWRHGR